MPKKHRRSFIHTKPINTPHHSLGSSGANENANQTGRIPYAGSSRDPGGAADDSSVNDLIGHLRRTQVSSSAESSSSTLSHSFVSHRSVPPALRNILELPEPSTPRPRPTPIGGRPRRFVPGPPPPESWLTGTTRSTQTSSLEEDIMHPKIRGYVLLNSCLDRLPGTVFPQPDSLKHAVLKSMAQNWDWHLDYDGLYLSQIPAHLKTLVLSYIAFYSTHETRKNYIKGLKPLYLTKEDYSGLNEIDSSHSLNLFEADSMTTRLDMSNAIGYWMTFPQLFKELQIGNVQNSSSEEATEDYIPESWDETEYEAEASSIPRPMGHTLRFSNLKYLSFAHPFRNTQQCKAEWSSLLKLLSHIPTITHLSLAHWPLPSRHPIVPRENTSNDGSQRQPQPQTRLGSRSPIWAEASAVLRELSRTTYCLKWLDLEGCLSWLPALTWMGLDPDGAPYPPGTNGPDWAGSWRNVNYLNLAPGWVSKRIDEMPDHYQLPDKPENEITYDSEEERRRLATYFKRFQQDVLEAEEIGDIINRRRVNAKGKRLAVKTGREDLEGIRLRMTRSESATS